MILIIIVGDKYTFELSLKTFLWPYHEKLVNFLCILPLIYNLCYISIFVIKYYWNLSTQPSITKNTVVIMHVDRATVFNLPMCTCVYMKMRGVQKIHQLTCRLASTDLICSNTEVSVLFRSSDKLSEVSCLPNNFGAARFWRISVKQSDIKQKRRLTQIKVSHALSESYLA